jgi:hypothetical protein
MEPLPPSLLEETHISPLVTTEDAQRFFEQYGIFYAPDANIGRLVAELGSEAVHGKIRMGQFPICDSVYSITSSDFFSLTSYSDFKRLSGHSPNHFASLLAPILNPFMPQR